jgi:hypothetical protein
MIQWLVYTLLDDQGIPPPDISIMFRGPSGILFMGGRRLLQLPL